MPRPVPVQLASSPLPASNRDFSTIFAQEFSYVWRALARLGVNDADREDLAHEVFFQVYRQLPTADLERPLRPWLFGFAFRIASTHRRLARHRYERSCESMEVTDSTPSAHEALERREVQNLVDEALEDLSLEQRAVFVLHDIDGCTMPEIVAALSVPLNTAYSRLRLARTRFTSAVRRLKAQRGMQ